MLLFFIYRRQMELQEKLKNMQMKVEKFKSKSEMEVEMQTRLVEFLQDKLQVKVHISILCLPS